jgi:excisionase family DNA binding protein
LGCPGGEDLPKLCCVHSPTQSAGVSISPRRSRMASKGLREASEGYRGLDARSARMRGRLAWCRRSSRRREDDVQDSGRDDRITVAEAAKRLGITKEAVRKRVSRGTLRSDKDQDGTVRVYVPASGSAAATFDRDELIAELRARIEDLRTDRDAWRDQARRSDYMASAALDRTRELENRLRELEAPAPSEARESDVSPGPTGELKEVREELAAEQDRREMAESTLHEGMAEEQRRREEAERERDELRQELHALREPRESPQTAEEELQRAEPRPVTVESQEGAQRPWWRRMFGG